MYETTKVRNYESTKQRVYETTKVRNNERTRLETTKGRCETAKVRDHQTPEGRCETTIERCETTRLRNIETAKQRKTDAKQQEEMRKSEILNSENARWPYIRTP